MNENGGMYHKSLGEFFESRSDHFKVQVADAAYGGKDIVVRIDETYASSQSSGGTGGDSRALPGGAGPGRWPEATSGLWPAWRPRVFKERMRQEDGTGSLCT